MYQTCDIAVLDAASLAGEAILKRLEDSNIEVGVLYPLSEELTEGAVIEFRDEELDVLGSSTFNFADASLFFIPAGSRVEAEIINRARDSGCMVVNASSAEHEHLVLPGLNNGLLATAAENREVGIPSSVAGLLIKLLKPVQDAVGIDSLSLLASLSVSRQGNKGIEELRKQTIDLLSGKPVSSDEFPQRAAFNLIPQVGERQSNGSTDEELDIVRELMAGLESEDLRVSATCMIAPVFYGESLAIHLDLDRAIDVPTFTDLVTGIEGIELAGREEVPTVETAAGSDDIIIGRIRQNPLHADQISFWLVADAVRNNANNAVTVAEILLKDFLKC